MSVNISKSAMPPAAWAESLYPTPEARQAYLERNEIPWLPESVADFEAFFDARRKALAERIVRLLGSAVEPAETPELAEGIDDELAVAYD